MSGKTHETKQQAQPAADKGKGKALTVAFLWAVRPIRIRLRTCFSRPTSPKGRAGKTLVLVGEHGSPTPPRAT